MNTKLSFVFCVRRIFCRFHSRRSSGRLCPSKKKRLYNFSAIFSFARFVV
uniref:Uncharacterized protein n=1 Tax=Ascaris lumbricoides TaxID=6252 RepID=A0A0M3HMB1_ASCLU